MADTIDTATSLTGDAEQGADLMRQGRFAETAMMMQGVVAAEPENEAAWRLLAGALASQSDYAGALPAFERVVELAPANPRNHYNLAVALQALGHVDDARASAERALSLDPAYAAARTFLNVTASEQPSAGIAPTADIPPRPNYAASSMTGLASIGDVAAAGVATDRPSENGPYAPVGGLSSVGGAVLRDPAPEPPSAYASRPPVGAYASPNRLSPSQYDVAENTSGMKGTVPAEITGGWNWGGFFLSWIWCLNHGLPVWGVVILLGSAIPGLRLVADIYLGVKGNDLAWQNRRFDSVDQFRDVQRIWRNWGLFLIVGVFGIAVLAAILFPVFAMARHQARGY